MAIYFDLKIGNMVFYVFPAQKTIPNTKSRENSI